jgi:hypothetical protein
MNKEQLLLYYIIGYLLLLIFWVCAWNIIDSCLEKVTNNNKFLRNNKMLFNLFLLVLIASILMKHYDYKFNINS